MTGLYALWRRARRVADLWLAASLIPVLGLWTQATAANQGGLASSSQGAVFISMVSVGLVRISKLNDINLGAWSGGDLSGSDSLCGFSDTWDYTLSAPSMHGVGTGFRMTDGAGNHITY